MICTKSQAKKRALLALAFSVSLALPLSVQAQQDKPAQPREVPEERLLPKEEPDGAADRKQLLGELYQRLRKTKDANSAGPVTSAIEKLWQRSGSDTVDLLMSRVTSLLESKELDAALKILDAVIEIAPDYSEGWNKRAVVFFVKQDYGQSLESLRHALAIDPSHYKAIQGLGILMQELGDKEAALKAYRRALKVNPQLEQVRRSVQELSREVEGQGI